MKNCESTASKSLAEQLVETNDSISIDRRMTSALQQNDDKPSNQHFSVRGYVADMKMKNPKACYPFDGFENSEILQEQLQGPRDVPQQISSVEHREAGVNRGPPYGQAVLSDLNARIAYTADIQRNPQQRRNISSCTLDLSLSLCCPETETKQVVGAEGISLGNPSKRKGIVDALANNCDSALKSRRMMQMGKFLEKPFTSCEIIDLESPSFSTHGSTRPLATTFNANHGEEFVEVLETGNAKRPFPFSENAGPMSTYETATRESSRPPGGEQKRPVMKSVTGADPRIQNVLDHATLPMSRPLNPIDGVCLINKNPADFNEACDPGNIYTR